MTPVIPVIVRAVMVIWTLLFLFLSLMKLSIWVFFLTLSPTTEKMSPIVFLRLCLPPSSFDLSWLIVPCLPLGNSRSIVLLSSPSCSTLWRVHNSHLHCLQTLSHVHFKSLRRIFRIKSSFYHRVLYPTDEDCSNAYLASLSYDSSRVITPSQIYSQNRLTLLGHLFRHPTSLEYSSTFMPSGQYRYTRGPNRV